MTDRIIELPPLPDHWEPSLTAFVLNWGKAAIEADRQRRSKPVAYAVFADNGNIRLWSSKPVDNPAARPLYAGPQPVENVKHDPIGFVSQEIIDWLNEPLLSPYADKETSVHKSAGDGADVAIYTVPQIAEPVRVLSDDEDYITEFLSEHADHNTEHGRMSFDKWTLRDAVRALLASCGSPSPQSADPVMAWRVGNDLFRTEEEAQANIWNPDLKPVHLCDCELGHNGMGMMGRKCDCDAQQPAEPVKKHPDDEAVDAMAIAMKAKLARKRSEGRDGWQSMSASELSALLHEHVAKGDPLDVANIAMMLHQNGQRVEPAKDRPTDVEKNNSTVTLHFESSEAASRWYANASNETSLCWNGEPMKVPSSFSVTQTVKSDGNHAFPPCDDPKCWHGRVNVRHETVSEHIARDIREGRFPEKSDRKTVSVSVPSSFPTGMKYSVEPHGNGYAIYQGRGNFHHGFNMAHLTECTPEFSKRIESALNAMSGPVEVLSDDYERGYSIGQRDCRERYEEVLAGHQRLVRELDVLLNGDGAAEQASLCDIVAQVHREGIKAARPEDQVELPRSEAKLTVAEAKELLGLPENVHRIYLGFGLSVMGSKESIELIKALYDHVVDHGETRINTSVHGKKDGVLGGVVYHGKSDHFVIPSDAEIREIFLANGFTIKPGSGDLKPYVYKAARSLIDRCVRSNSK